MTREKLALPPGMGVISEKLPKGESFFVIIKCFQNQIANVYALWRFLIVIFWREYQLCFDRCLFNACRSSSKVSAPSVFVSAELNKLSGLAER